MTVLNGLLDGIAAACHGYLTKPDAEAGVTAEVNDILAKVPKEREVITNVAAYWGRNTPTVGAQKWFQQLRDDPNTYQFRTLNDTDAKDVTPVGGAKAQKGQNKEVNKVTNASGDTGFFAEDDETKKYDDDAKYGNARWVLENYGMKDEDLKLGNRSIAMSRLDRLLGAGVIARTEAALKNDSLGTFQWEAKGLPAVDQLTAHDASHDANLPRLLSKLQLIDTIAGQVDRHAKNYFVQMDQSGNVTGITGIDLDMSFVKGEGRFEFDVEGGSRSAKDKGKTDHFPGFSRFCDRELADDILDMQPDDLRFILLDLLDKDSIDAAVARLTHLQGLLQELKDQGKLLEPGDWDQHVRAQIIDEKKSYYSNAMGGG